jgi:thiol:disulfide interchange protein DsbA
MHRIVMPLLGWSLALLIVVAIPAHGEVFKDGKDYFTLSSPVPVRDKSKVEVVEMFWYGCPHCYSFDPLVNAWRAKQPEFVDFWRSPAVFSNTWKIHAQAFYTAEVLNVGEEMHQPLFDALVRDKKKLNSENALAKFFAGYGVAAESFRKAYNSFSVKSRVEQAHMRSVNYRLTGVPAIIVNGKYRVEPGGAGNFQRFLEIVDYLVEMEHKMPAS